MKLRTTCTKLALLGAVFCAANAGAQVKIGFLGTLSGPGGALGQDQYDAFMLAMAQKGNKLGGVPVQVIKADDELRPDIGVQAARKLIEEDKVSIITGMTFGNVMMAVAKPVTAAGVVLISSNASPAPLAGKDCAPLMFSVSSGTMDQINESGGNLMQVLGYKRVYVMAPNYQAGRDAIQGFKHTYKQPLVDEVYTPLNQLDFSAEIAQLQAANPDAVYVFYPGSQGVNFVKQYRQAGLMGKLPLVSVATVDGTTLPALQEAAVGAITASAYSPDLDNAQNKQFVAAFKQKYRRAPSMYAAASYDAAQLLDVALRKVGGNVTDKNALRAAIKSSEFESVRGNFKFDTNQFGRVDFYRVDVVKDAAGVDFATHSKIKVNYRNRLVDECSMK
ncbi:ABC transporter substrate-binding protein [Paraburkholderia sp. CNPSo 3076]|uniref:ABC transporter substrate-binding protein n=1 Tax=Paraburkholderia sp. CNPSo 3076 TaxID=2940936 RepID=UPI002256365E|nr:ABC transporter substrate-binding protein [Paraburkholderia sp. CNPSo 3076]MCX5538303.1 ABC transporter substrate-binding protein [Paraburkholderia sp. CNPSo 3076]